MIDRFQRSLASGSRHAAAALAASIALTALAWAQAPTTAPPAAAAPSAAPAAAPPAPASGAPTYAELRARVPYDLITTSKAFNNEVYQVEPIPFTNREVPTMPKPTDKLIVRRLNDDQQSEIQWFNIERIDLYEDILLAEANQLVRDAKLDDAFDYFHYLQDVYPRTKGLGASHQNYLYLCVADARKRDAYDEALAVAEALYQRNPNFHGSSSSPPLMDEIGQLTDHILDVYVKKDDFRSAKTLLKRLESRYGRDAAFTRSWRQKLSEIAARHRDEASRHLADGRFVEAYDACAAMIAVWPEVEGGPELAAEIARRYPLVIVGVAQPALAHDGRSLADSAARRTGRLIERRLMEFAGLGPEGGTYNSPFATFSVSDDQLQLTFQMKSAQIAASHGGVTGFDVARHLLELADPASPEYQPQLARLLDRVEVRKVDQVVAELKVPHVLPQAFLQTSYDSTPNVGAPGVNGSGPYFVLLKDEKVARFTRNDRYAMFASGQPAEIMERFYDDSKRGILALERGEVDVLDEVFPGDVPELKANRDIVVGRYSIPTIHFLTIARRHPYLTNRTFRRALAYGSDREAILRTSLLKLPANAASPPGYRVISAPFPAPVSAGDSTAYGYDDAITPRTFNPWLALVLKAVAANELKSQYEKQEKKAPVLTPLTLGHPADEISRIACRILARQWKAIGIETKTVEFPPGIFVDQKEECDLVYTHAATWEPIVDAGRLLAPGGLSPADNTYVSLMLRRVESAKDWIDARRALRDLHRQLHEDVTVLPLWQTFDYYAWRQSVQGLRDGQASLYETVDQWKVAPRLAGN
ncbi:MAG TPA: ABC transporter substrate-binding protein [Pirellulaceae bacterium]|nr:ABC transporter substrate-binding protein [Pirellulaceae bacterium]